MEVLGNVDITTNNVCAGNLDDQGKFLGGKDTCNMDSGGPLIFNNNGHYELVGATSRGLGCARIGVPGIYADVFSKKINPLKFLRVHLDA